MGISNCPAACEDQKALREDLCAFGGTASGSGRISRVRVIPRLPSITSHCNFNPHFNAV